jgi:hypothetical protein
MNNHSMNIVQKLLGLLFHESQFILSVHIFDLLVSVYFISQSYIIILVLFSEAMPRLFIISSDGRFLSRRGVHDVSRKGIEALKTWLRGETVAPPTADEYEWEEDISCARCSNNSIIGQLYRCVACDNHSLCSACEKKGHEHPLELVEQPTHYEDG